MLVLRSRLGTILVALAMVASAAVAGALIGEVTGADAVVESGDKPVMIGMDPTRALDTRPAPFGPIGVATAAPIGAKGVLDLTLGGVHGIPADATAVQLNITSINATAETFLTLYPTGSTRPNASTMNPDVGLTQFNGAVIPLGTGGALSIFNHLGSVDVIIDVTGYFVDHNHNDKYYMMDETDAKYLESTPGIELWAAANVLTTAPRLRSNVGAIASVTSVGTGDTRITFTEDLKPAINAYDHTIQVTSLRVSAATCQWRYDGASLDSIRVRCFNAAGAALDSAFNINVYQITDSLVSGSTGPGDPTTGIDG